MVPLDSAAEHEQGRAGSCLPLVITHKRCQDLVGRALCRAGRRCGEAGSSEPSRPCGRKMISETSKAPYTMLPQPMAAVPKEICSVSVNRIVIAAPPSGPAARRGRRRTAAKTLCSDAPMPLTYEPPLPRLSSRHAASASPPSTTPWHEEPSFLRPPARTLQRDLTPALGSACRRARAPRSPAAREGWDIRLPCGLRTRPGGRRRRVL